MCCDGAGPKRGVGRPGSVFLREEWGSAYGGVKATGNRGAVDRGRGGRSSVWEVRQASFAARQQTGTWKLAGWHGAVGAQKYPPRQGAHRAGSGLAAHWVWTCVLPACAAHAGRTGFPAAAPWHLHGHARAQPTRPRRLAGGPGAHGHARRAFWAWLAGSIARVLSHLPCPVTGSGRLSRRFRLSLCAGRPARHLKRCRRAHTCRYASLGVASARPKGRHRAAH